LKLRQNNSFNSRNEFTAPALRLGAGDALRYITNLNTDVEMTMRKLLLATVASMALTVPAFAQNAPGPDRSQQPPQMQQEPAQPQGMQEPSSTGRQHAAISPSRLNRTQVRNIQQALDSKGFSTRGTDGRWGPETEAALRKFQQQQNIGGDGQLNHETLAALGVNLSARGTRSTTGAGANEQGSGNMAPNGMNAQPPSSGSSNPGGMGRGQ
jgi:murein L,D-transpeptidase YcbB/YkuD